MLPFSFSPGPSTVICRAEYNFFGKKKKQQQYKFLYKFFWVHFQSAVNFDYPCQRAFGAESVYCDLQADKYIGKA